MQTIRTNLLAVQRASGLAFSRRAYTKNGKALRGLTKNMKWFRTKDAHRRYMESGVSSLGRGRRFDRVCAHLFNCGKSCSCPKLARCIPRELKHYFADAELLGIKPVVSQLVAEHSGYGTGADDVMMSKDGLVVIERKTGYLGNIDYVPKKAPPHEYTVPWSIRGEHMIQAALTARMIENTYGQPVKQVWVAYVDRTRNSTFLSPDRDMSTKLEWIPVHRQPWFIDVSIAWLAGSRLVETVSRLPATTKRPPRSLCSAKKRPAKPDHPRTRDRKLSKGSRDAPIVL